jgi:hypothetical protein
MYKILSGIMVYCVCVPVCDVCCLCVCCLYVCVASMCVRESIMVFSVSVCVFPLPLSVVCLSPSVSVWSCACACACACACVWMQGSEKGRESWRGSLGLEFGAESGTKSFF